MADGSRDFRSEKLRAAAQEAVQHQPAFDAFIHLNPMNAVLFVKLISISDGRLAEAIVLFDAMQYAKNNGLGKARQGAGVSYTKRYGTHCSWRAFNRAISDLIAVGLLVELPQVRNVAKKFFLNWPSIEGAFRQAVDIKLPGLQCDESEPTP